MRRNPFQLLFFIIICLSIGWLGSLATRSSLTGWYAGLQKPPFNPPNGIFAPVWTFLYILMAIAGWRIWSHPFPGRGRLRLLFVAQLFLNGVWSFLFFGLHNPAIGLADILLLWIFLCILIRSAWQLERTTALLLTPYILWVSFAAYLNVGLWWLNR